MIFRDDKAHRKDAYLILLALILVVVGIYWQVWNFEFTNFDDDVLVYDNDLVRNGFSQENLVSAFTSMRDGAWMPLTWLSYMLDCQVFGLAAGFHHLTSVLLHLLNTTLVFLVLNNISGSVRRSFFVAALFGLHPLHVETVAWVADRKDLLCMFFWLAAVWSYGTWVRKPSLRGYLLLALSFTAALMSKAMAITLPLVLLLFDVWPLKRFSLEDLRGDRERLALFTRLCLEKVPLLALALASAMVATLSEYKIGMVISLDQVSLSTRLANATTTYITYLQKTIWPTRLVPFYLYPEHIPVWQWSGATIALVMITALALYFRRNYPYLLVGWLFYLITLLPVSGLVQLGAMARADRFTYLPLTGIFIMAVWGVNDLAKAFSLRRVPIMVAALIMLAALALVSWRQTTHWRNSRTLFEHTLAVDPRNNHAEVILGVYCLERGAYPEAIAHLTRAIALAPDDHEAYATLGNVYERMGRFNEAERYYKISLLIAPNFHDAYDSLGALSAKQGDLAIAEEYFRRSLGYVPESPKAIVNLALVLYLQSRLVEAETLFRRALDLDPRLAAAWNGLGLICMKQGRIAEAIANYQSALRLSPEFREAKNNLEVALAGQGRQ